MMACWEPGWKPQGGQLCATQTGDAIQAKKDKSRFRAPSRFSESGRVRNDIAKGVVEVAEVTKKGYGEGARRAASWS